MERKCTEEGKWEGKPGSMTESSQGWTNYTSCLLPEIIILMKKLGNASEKEVKVKVN